MAPKKACSFEWAGVRCDGFKKAAYTFQIGGAGSTSLEIGKVDLCEAHGKGLKNLQASPCKIYIGRKFTACKIERVADFVLCCRGVCVQQVVMQPGQEVGDGGGGVAIATAVANAATVEAAAEAAGDDAGGGDDEARVAAEATAATAEETAVGQHGTIGGGGGAVASSSSDDDDDDDDDSSSDDDDDDADAITEAERRTLQKSLEDYGDLQKEMRLAAEAAVAEERAKRVKAEEAAAEERAKRVKAEEAATAAINDTAERVVAAAKKMAKETAEEMAATEVAQEREKREAAEAETARVVADNATAWELHAVAMKEVQRLRKLLPEADHSKLHAFLGAMEKAEWRMETGE